MSHTLNKDEYYDVVVYEKSQGVPQLALKIYAWVSDFTDRRGMRQNWDAYISDEEQNEFMNKIFNLLQGKQINEEVMDEVTMEFKKLPGMSQTFDEIDDDIQQEIQEEWLKIFTD